MANGLVLPNPEKIGALQVMQRLEMVEEIWEDADEATVDAAIDWLSALQAARRHRSHHGKATRVERLYEARWGELHPAEQGKRTDLTSMSDMEVSIGGREMGEFRKMASYKPIVVEEVEAAKGDDEYVTRKQILDKIKSQTKEAKKAEREERKDAIGGLTKKRQREFSEICDIQHCSMADLLVSGIKPDCIITDPPYPKKYLSLYGELAECAKDVPLVAVMCGQSYLPEIMAMMTKHLRYRWILAYLTPGESGSHYHVKVNTFWKPILLFGENVDWIGDVSRSKSNDKRFHEWGQSESGMIELVEKLTKPGDLVCDPFCGAGTTAIAAMACECRFVGCDTDSGVAQGAITRCQEAYNDHR